jgi:regulator of nucleoside diphosphate kinase
MKTPIYLSEADQQRLHSILGHLAPSPWPNNEQAAALRALLTRTGKSRASEDLGDSISFFDEVALVSPTDPRDNYDFRIVMPADSDPDEDRVSVLLPVALAVLGRRRGDTVSWECPRGTREMRVAKVVKSAELVV